MHLVCLGCSMATTFVVLRQNASSHTRSWLGDVKLILNILSLQMLPCWSDDLVGACIVSGVDAERGQQTDMLKYALV